MIKWSVFVSAVIASQCHIVNVAPVGFISPYPGLQLTQGYYREPLYQTGPKYNFYYNVHDSLTGDIKDQEESRDGDLVKGHYSLVEADGTKRIVEYSADGQSGFNAIIRKEYLPQEQYQYQHLIVQQQAQIYQPLVQSSPVANNLNESDSSVGQENSPLVKALDDRNASSVDQNQLSAESSSYAEPELGHSNSLESQNQNYIPAAVYGQPFKMRLNEEAAKIEEHQTPEPSYSQSTLTLQQQQQQQQQQQRQQQQQQQQQHGRAPQLQVSHYEYVDDKPESGRPAEAEQRQSFGYSSIRIEQYHPTEPELPSHELLQRLNLNIRETTPRSNHKADEEPSSGCSHKLQEPTAAELNPQLEKANDLESPDNSGSKDENGEDFNRGYVYEKPAIKFELPLKNHKL